MSKSIDRKGAIQLPAAINASKPSGGTGNGPRDISTFLRCLRLLDLDLLHDWPDITSQTFSTRSVSQSLQTRLKCVEWSLYRLFELWEPHEAETRLRPFFPPLTSLQSLNLRAALYRSLDGLKKDGTLPRHITIRKTMLDECSGDKFEELLRCFAMAVLRKVTDQRHQASSYSACFQDMGLSSAHNYLPLILVHRYSLQKTLDERRSIQAAAQRYAEALHVKHSELKSRAISLVLDKAPSAAEAGELARTVRSNWIGSDRWADIILGVVTETDQTFFESPFEESWNAVQKTGSLVQDAQTSVLDQLNQRIAKQKERLARWKTFHASLLSAKNARDRILKTRASELVQKTPIAFNRHQSSRLQPFTALKQTESSPETIIPAHRELLNNMKGDLARLRSKSRPSRDDGVKSNQPDREVTPLIEDIPTSVDLVRANDLQDRELEPFKVKTGDSKASGARLTGHQKQPVNSSIPLADSIHDSNGSEDHILMAMVGLNIEDAHSTNHLQAGSATSPEEAARQALDDADIALALNSSSSIQPLSILPSTSPPAPSLAERTRMSMAMISTPNDRTQQYSKRPTQVRKGHVSQQYPVNQFEIPSKGPASETVQNSAQPHHSGASTPRDQIFSERAEYASVFKSRPRIPLSPTFSPDKSSFGFDNVLEQDLEKLTIDETC